MKLLILFLYPAIILAHTFVSELEDPENPFRPCQDYPDLFIPQYLDFSNINFQTFDNNTLHVQGYFEIIKHIKDIVGIKLEAYKKERGVYVNTIFSINRKDFCKSLFNPAEYWYQMVKDVPEEERKCPYQKGMNYHMNLYTDLEFDFPKKLSEGHYKLRGQLFYQTNNELIMCFDIFSNLYRL